MLQEPTTALCNDSTNKQVQTKEDIFSIAIPILKKRDVCRAFLFGSFAKGCQSDASDVDILVEFKPEVENRLSIMDMVRLKSELEEALGRSVDIAEEDFLVPIIKESVQRSKILIFETQ